MNSQWLNALFKNHPNKTKKSLADFLSMEPPAISKMLNGTRQIKAEEYVAMRAFFGMSNDGEHAVSVPVRLTTISRDLHHSSFAEGESGNRNQLWGSPTNIAQENSAVIYKSTMVIENPDDYMAPDFEIGDQILVNLDDRKTSDPGVFVVSDGVNYMVRQCELVTSAALLQIQISGKKEGFLPQALEIDEINIIGRVIGKVQIR